MCNSSFLPSFLPSSKHKGGVRKTLLCVATASALATMGHAAYADVKPDVKPGEAGEWSLIKTTYTSSSPDDRIKRTTDFDGALHLLKQDSSLPGNIKAVINQATIDLIRTQKNFEDFASFGYANEKYLDDNWTTMSVLMKADGTQTTLKNVSIELEVTSDTFVENLDAVGIYNKHGTLTFEGNETNVVVIQNGTQKNSSNPESDDVLDAIGYIAMDPTPDAKVGTVVTNFNADKTTFNVLTTSPEGMAWGMVSSANDPTRPVVNVAGDLEVHAKANGRAYGIYSMYNDWNLNENTNVDNPGSIRVAKNLTVTADSRSSGAYALVSEIGNVTVEGNALIEAAAERKPSYGIYATSNGHIILKGDETTVTADHALTIKRHDLVESLGDWMPSKLDTSVSLLSKETTLNGLVSTEEGTRLYVANTLNFNGDADIQGQILADSDVAFNIAAGKMLTFGESKDSAKNAFKNLTLAGGTFSNASQMTVDGTLTLNGVELINKSEEGKKTAEIDVTGAGKVVFGNGTKVTNYGGLHAKHYKLETGSLYLEEDDEFTISGEKLATTFSEDILELAGGMLSNIGDGASGKAELALSEIHLVGKDGSANDGVIMVSNGTYDFDAVTVNIAPQSTEPASARLMVTGDNAVLNVGTFNATQGSASIADKGTFTVTSLNANGKFELDAQSAKSFTVETFKGAEGGDFKLTGGTMNVTAIDLAAGKLTIGGSSSLVTVSGQIFTNALNADGLNIDAGALKHSGLVFEEGGTLTLTDGKYNIVYAKNAQSILNTGKLEFTGTLVDITGDELPNLDLDKTPEDVTLGGTDLNATADQNGTVTVDKTVGGKTLVVDGGTKVTVSQDKTLTLVGGADASGELIKFKDAAGDKTVTASGEKGGVTLGSESDQKTGTLSATVNLTQKATLTAQNGAFTVEAVKAQDANVAVNSGELIVNKLEMSGMSAISSNATGKTKVAELSFGKDGTTTVTGAVSADKIVAQGNATINIGKTGEDGERGDLTIGEGSIKGLTFFLDPTWVDGQEVTDASRLVLNQTTLDGNVIVGENSYVVLGTDTDADFVKLFADKTLTWGKGEGKTLAAAYVAKPIDVTAGSLVVDGTLTSAPANEAAGTVKFAAGSVLVADVTDLTTDKALITGTTFDVDAASKAVIIGQLKNGETYKLTTDADSKFWNTEKTLVAGNKLWDFTVNEDGSFTTKLTDAALVYGELMQGHELANAATEAGNAYGNELLTETEGLSNAAIAARFDAAMNTAGAAAVFTTAYDRASELRDAVRGEALEGEGNRLWAQVTGGKTKLNGLSSGAQSIHVDTDTYGLVVGGDVALSNGVLGAAFTAGTGDSENDDVGVKDDFDFYGLSVYGKTSVGGIDLLADGSMTFVKSDLTMGGVADVDTDTTTAVYSLGVQAQRTWDYVVAITPFVGIDIYHVRGDGYDNGHGAQVDDAHATAVEFPIGATIAKAFETNGFKLSPNFSFAVVPTVGDRDIDSKVRFAGAESTYNFTFADDVKVRTNLGVAAEKDNFRFGLNAGYDWGNEERSATKLMLNAQYRF